MPAGLALKLDSGFATGPEGAAERAVRDVERAALDHARLVYRVAYSVLRSPQDAEDATQEVFLRVLRLRPDLDGIRDPGAWLARVAFRVALDRRSKRTVVSIEDPSVAGEVRSLAASGEGADERASARQVQRLLARAIEGLPEELRSVVQLSTVEELDSARIAEVIGIPEGTVRSRLFRARRILKDALADSVGRPHD